MRIAIVGIGDIAEKAYLPILTQLEEVELVFCTRNKMTLQRLAKQYHIKQVYQDYRQLSHVNVDAVMIHSSTASHLEIASFFLQLGVPTFVDKPLADNAFDCEKIYELAQKQQQPLYMGFNRRFIPLYKRYFGDPQSTLPDTSLLSLRWEKNRHNLPGDIRKVIFDDFIHPLDSVNLCAKSNLEDVHLSSQFKGTQLARIDVQWQDGNMLLHASMNRLHGITHERVSVGFENRAYEFDSFMTGKCLQDKQTFLLQLKDWTPMLTAKGFTAMIADWINVVKSGQMKQSVIERNLSTHQLAEAVCQKVQTKLSGSEQKRRY
ncbi:Gfo/Idh/MocA family protein [Psychromonas antarctica]|uniref:Gfo/Idh/MocA family protein n=1 Tax=Psychromonas antarctica TaxID=67573 RepID=UPI001EE87E2A|nr:Gfo/Idh/MocA family oxidoreductase [Psychromonas antarctica]MCG6200109.1 Gfo/Idh/MocA family oxidoreductase [Psychromonas antarctica]